MKLTAQLDRAGSIIARRLQNGSGAFPLNLERQLTAVGSEGTQHARSTFLTGGTTSTRTAVRSGTRLRSYTHRIKQRRGGAVMDWGPIRASGGKVPIHLRVHEGFDAAGNRVSQFIIKPKQGAFGRFPIRKGGGLSAGGIVGWRTYTRSNPVVLRPRPTFDAMEPWFAQRIPGAVNRAFVATVEGQ